MMIEENMNARNMSLKNSVVHPDIVNIEITRANLGVVTLMITEGPLGLQVELVRVLHIEAIAEHEKCHIIHAMSQASQ